MTRPDFPDPDMRFWFCCLFRDCRRYRDVQHLPICRAAAAESVRSDIEMIRVRAGHLRMSQYRRPSWWDYMPPVAA